MLNLELWVRGFFRVLLLLNKVFGDSADTL